jgi:hypothetical protein
MIQILEILFGFGAVTDSSNTSLHLINFEELLVRYCVNIMKPKI